MVHIWDNILTDRQTDRQENYIFLCNKNEQGRTLPPVFRRRTPCF